MHWEAQTQPFLLFTAHLSRFPLFPVLWFFSQGRWGVQTARWLLTLLYHFTFFKSFTNQPIKPIVPPSATRKAHSQPWRASSPDCTPCRALSRSDHRWRPGLYWVKGIPWMCAQFYEDYYHIKCWTPCVFYQETWRSKYRDTENLANATKKRS